MVLHTCWDPTRLVIMTVGDGSLVFEAIRLRLPVLIIVRNLTVKKYVLRNLQERLTKCVCVTQTMRDSTGALVLILMRL